MEIIKQGKLPEDETYEHTCSRCGTLFRFQRREGTYYSDQRDGEWIEIECPYCHTTVYHTIRS